jgi:glycosyltransferase involved in cell wall biosynthesis
MGDDLSACAGETDACLSVCPGTGRKREAAMLMRGKGADATAPGTSRASGANFPRAEMTGERLKALLVDPSLFTAPYDAALTKGLGGASVETRWVTRPLRGGEEAVLPSDRVNAFFYRRAEGAKHLSTKLKPLLKGFGHAAGLIRLVVYAVKQRPDVVHFQWTVLPLLDAVVIAALRRWRPIVLTVHDPVPFNGQRMPLMQRLGFDFTIGQADRVIVHTAAGRDILAMRGVAAEKISIVPHGPLKLAREEMEGGDMRPEPSGARRDPRWTFVLFGNLKPYKGLDVLIEAIGLMPTELRDSARFVVAGAAKMDLDPIMDRIRQLDLHKCVELRIWHHSETDMAELFREADTFVFPYRQIDASGVYFLVKGRGKWIVATRVGIFAEDVEDGIAGDLVAPDDAPGLAASLARAVQERPVPAAGASGTSWQEIGLATRDIYLDVIARV